MFKHTVVTLFKSFSKEEVDRFDKFLNSPYFNRSKKISKLYEEIVRFYPLFDDKDLTKQNLCIRTSQSGSFNESTLRDSLSVLLKYAQKFLVIEKMELHKDEALNYLLSELMYRNQEKLFSKVFMEAGTELSRKPKEDSGYYYNSYLRGIILFNFETMYDKVLHKNEAINKFNNLTNISVNLFKFFLIEIISLVLNQITLANKFNLEYKTSYLYLTFSKLNINNLLNTMKGKTDSNLVNIYEALLKMYISFDNDSFYANYKSLLTEYFDNLSTDEKSFHLHCSINYCIIKKKNYSNDDYEKELFGLYELMLKERYFEDNKTKYITIDLYRDILLLGLSMKKFRWVEEFIAKYNRDLPPGEQENILNYSYTQFYFSVGDYYNALEYYNKIIVNNFVYKYDIKNLVLKLYYEVKYYEEALDEIHSYKEFLRNNQLVTKERKERLGNFLWFLEKLLYLEIEYNGMDCNYLIRKLTNKNNVSFKKWLLEKFHLLTEKHTGKKQIKAK